MSSEPETDATPPAAPEPSDAATASNGDSSDPSEQHATPPSADVAPSDDSGGPAGEGGDDDAGDESASDDEGAAETSEGSDADTGTAGAAGTKPKRKRRRKKKSGGAPGAQPGAQAQQGQNGPRPGGSKKQRHRASDRAPFHVGEEVFGKVTAVLDAAVMVDLSGKALAIFDRSEMEADDLIPSPGDRFVARVHVDGLRGGLVVLTRKPLREEETKPKLEQAHKDGTLVTGLVTGVIKGGVEVDVGGVRAFAPASGLDLHPANANFTGLVGQRLEFKVAQYEKAGRDVVVTRRPMLEAEAHERRKHALGLLTEGQVMTGVVRTVVEWGVFVALPEAENVEGLIHVSEASHDAHPDLSDLFRHGDKLEVKILGIDERGKIWLSRKALIEDPWGQARAKYANGTRHTGKVIRLEKFGAFIELEPGMDALLHVADLSFERIEHPNEILKEGQDIDVVIQYFDQRTKKIGVHLAPSPEQANEPHQKITRGASIKAAVVKGESAGVIVRVLGATGRAARGFIPAGQTGTPRGTDLRKSFKPGTVLDLKVLDLDPRSGEPKLSVRGFKDDEERRAHREYRQKLKAEGGFGTLGDLLKQKLGAVAASAPAAPEPPEQPDDQSHEDSTH
jgi:small subunit ribosomal protein S1